MDRRVVITGIGAVTPIGNNAEEFWNGIKEGKCGVDNITLFDTSTFKTKLGAEVKNFNEEENFDAKQIKRLDRVSKFAIVSAREAFKDSKITEENTDFNNVGIFISSGIGGLITIENQCEVNIEKGNNRISPMFIPMSIANMPAGNIAIDLHLKGESISIVTACASSTHAIGEAYRTIKNGYEDVILAGGSEAAICPVGVAGFENMKALSNATDKKRASIPFDKERSGFVIGEGAGVVVLEELEHAKKRNAKIYAELVGYGATSDAYHITSPDPSGDGAVRAMKRALEDAKVDITDIDYINAHGTSTSLNDSTETKAIKTLMEEISTKQGKNDKTILKEPLVSSTKSSTGHLLGAAGAIEAIVCAKAIEESIVPANINYKVSDEECNLNIVANKVKEKELNLVMSNSLGFGGHNASIILKKY